VRRRLQSPLQEMDGVSTDGSRDEEELVAPRAMRQPQFEEAVTMQGMAELLSTQLSTQLAPVKSALANLTSDFNSFKIQVHQDLTTVGARLTEMEKRIDMNSVRVDKLENLVNNMSSSAGVPPELINQISDLQMQVDQLRMGTSGKADAQG
jgi:hypothetical protein